MSWQQVMQGSTSYALKRFISQIIEHKVYKYDDLLTRIGFHLVTEKDIQTFADLVNDLISAGYAKAIDDYKDQLNALGVKVQSEKLG